MFYRIKEIFYSLQGEGYYAGRPAIFCRFSGCNLWNGKEEDRNSSACQFCDTDFLDTNGHFGGKYTAQALVRQMLSLWPKDCNSTPFCVLTGGEPALQFDELLKSSLKNEHFEIAIETNGSLPLKAIPDWICVSPKGKTSLAITTGNELKLVWPQPMHPVDPKDYQSLNFTHFYLQPIDIANQDYRQACVDYCLTHPQWQLSLQIHKLLGIE